MTKRNKKYKVLHLNDDLMEYLPYTDPTFPVEIYDDYFSDFPEHTLPCHWHPVYEFNTVISGQITYTINGKDYLLNAGDSIFINSGIMHTAKSCSKCPDSIVYGFTFDSSLITTSRNSVYYVKYFSPIDSVSVPAFKIPGLSDNRSPIQSIISELYSLKTSDPVYELQCMELIIKTWKILFQIISESGLADPVYPYEKNNTEKIAELKAIMIYINNHYGYVCIMV
jgi:AraC family transcriptional regulator, melibiose operon regulatory protein